MKTLLLISLAASAAAAPALAAGRDQTVAPPTKWEDVPNAKLKAPPGTSWKAPPAPPAPMAAPMRQAPPPVVRKVETVRVPAAPPAHHAAPAPHGPAHAATHHDGGHGKAMHSGKDGTVVHHGDTRVEHRRFVERRSYPHYSRVERGHRVDPYWLGEGYHVRDWNRYGFSPPYHDRRWIRYYDDALLIDGYGTVHDGRYGMDWDEYGDGWDHDDRGVPVYDGDDYYADDEDHGYGEGHGDYEDDRGYGHGGYGGHYAYPGYGYYYGGMVTVTETTVTTGSTVCCDEAAPRHKVKKRHYKSRR